MEITNVPLADIFCDHDFNCRGHFKAFDVLDLVKSIEAHGLQQPIVVQKWDKKPGYKYRILSGHRRYTAFKNMKLPTIPCIIRDGVGEFEARVVNLEENLKRKNLNILQEAKAIVPFVEAGWTQTEIAQKLDESTNWVHVRICLLKLPEDVQMEAAAGFLTQEQIKQLSKVRSKEKIYDAVLKIKNSKLLGDKRKIEIVKKKPAPFSKRMRTREDIFKIMAILQDTIGNDFNTRLLAWCAGEINEFEFQRDLKAHIESKGYSYNIPQDLVEEAFLLHNE